MPTDSHRAFVMRKDRVMLIIPNLTVYISFSPNSSSFSPMELVGVLLYTSSMLDRFNICWMGSKESMYGDSHKQCSLAAY